MLQKCAESVGLEVRSNPFANAYKLQKHLIKAPNPVIFDVGAHIGQTYLLYRKLFPAAKLFAFEPYPASFTKLNQSVGSDSATLTFQLALSDNDGQVPLHVNAADATSSLLPTHPAAAGNWGSGLLETSQIVNVRCRTLDSLSSELDLKHIDILKIDVQGSELAVLHGANKLLTRKEISLLYCEVIVATTYKGQDKLHDYLRFMESLDYRLIDFFNPVRRDGRLLQFDLMYAAPALLES